MSFAPNGAVPGDRIVGIMTPGEGITVYPIQSPALAAFDDQPERWLDVRWDVEDSQALFPARIIVAAINEPGSLGAVAMRGRRAGRQYRRRDLQQEIPGFPRDDLRHSGLRPETS